jgi:hypothetical protein
LQAVDIGPARARLFPPIRKKAVDDEGVDGYNNDGKQGGNNKSEWNRDSFFDRERILNCVVFQREVLVEGRYDSIDQRVDGGEDAEEDSSCETGQKPQRVAHGLNLHKNHIVEDI